MLLEATTEKKNHMSTFHMSGLNMAGLGVGSGLAHPSGYTRKLFELHKKNKPLAQKSKLLFPSTICSSITPFDNPIGLLFLSHYFMIWGEMHRNIYFFEKKKERGDRTELRKFYRDESEKQRSSTSHHGVPLSEMPRPWPTQQACPRGAPSTSASHARRRRRSTIPDLTPIATAATAAISLPPDLPPRRRAADTAEKMGGGGSNWETGGREPSASAAAARRICAAGLDRSGASANCSPVVATPLDRPTSAFRPR